jgi:glyoxylase-like metal-dependent hydrolase (beta-lactamase superfamily II)
LTRGLLSLLVPTIGRNIQRAVDDIASANGVSNKITYLVYSHHHADHIGASSLFDRNVTRIGHEETRRLLQRDADPARPPNEETFQDRRTLEISGERIELAWHGANHTPDNILIHLPDHDALMLVDIVNPGWAPVYLSNISQYSRGGHPRPNPVSDPVRRRRLDHRGH